MANTPPGRNSNSPSTRFHTDTPVTSDGRRSGVNWTRCQVPPIERAIALASEVLPTPGTSSMRRWPDASRQTSARCTASRLPWMTCSTLSTSARNNGSTRPATHRRSPVSAGARFGLGHPLPLPPWSGCRRTSAECTGWAPGPVRETPVTCDRSWHCDGRTSARDSGRGGPGAGAASRACGRPRSARPVGWPGRGGGGAPRSSRCPTRSTSGSASTPSTGRAGVPDPEDLVVYLRWCKGRIEP